MCKSNRETGYPLKLGTYLDDVLGGEVGRDDDDCDEDNSNEDALVDPAGKSLGLGLWKDEQSCVRVLFDKGMNTMAT